MSRAHPYRFRLPNGLRVVTQQLSGTASVGVAVHYGVGFRSEPPGRSGFAHLFEHVMFQGSARVGPADHFRYIQAAGGTANGSTHQDYTDYYQILPASALERALYLEADRMRSLRITEQTFRTQRAVVEEEIRQAVTDRPYGGFPWTVLPGVLYRTHANAHNGYGDFTDLAAATSDECQSFFDTYYTPSNAVLTICGDVEPGHARELAELHFGPVPARPGPLPVNLAEPELRAERRGVHYDRHAPAAATAIGYRMPDPVAELPAYLAQMVLARLLTGGETARLKHRLIQSAGLLTDISSSCGLFGPLQARAPETLVLLAMHADGATTDRVTEALDAELAGLAGNGPGADELLRATALTAAGVWRGFDDLTVRTRALGTYELLFGNPGLVDELGRRLTAVTAAEVTDAAAALRPEQRAVLSLIPGAPATAAPAGPVPGTTAAEAPEPVPNDTAGASRDRSAEHTPSKGATL
ncbi:pitrilysin family protein [Streptomyces varsoviensis]|uniref:M16 family metallopeptidase n=1 Tax=Streptomyces varsoviensis TaxID=67373 RepID=UPI0033D8DEFC